MVQVGPVRVRVNDGLVFVGVGVAGLGREAVVLVGVVAIVVPVGVLVA